MPESDLQASLRNADQRARWARRLLIGSIILNILAILSGYSQLTLLRRAVGGEQISEAEATANDSRQQTIGVLQLILLVITAIVFLMWLYRAYGSLRLVGTGRTKYTPGWAVGYWFIPIINLIRPYHIMKELWLRVTTLNAADPGDADKAPSIIGWWWLTWVTAGLFDRLVFSRISSADNVPEYIAATELSVAVDLLSVIAAFLAIKVVRMFNEQQQALLTGQPASILSPA